MTKPPVSVTFVSSGPGDPELMTLKAIKRLEAAEVILYDDLSATPALAFANPQADLISVGKRAGRASPKQDHVSRLLVDHARSGARVVRLKSGDAGIFGRLEEELSALQEAGIGFEIVPGVTAPSAAAAAFGMPLTRRKSARRVQFVTGTDVSGTLPEGLNWAALADPQAVTAIYMARATFPDFAQGLIAAGLSAQTPTLLASGVSTPEQGFTRGTIASLAALCRDQPRDAAPSLILYGALSEV